MSLSTSTILALLTNLSIGAYFLYLWKGDDNTEEAYGYWSLSCFLFCIGLCAGVAHYVFPALFLLNVVSCLSLVSATYFLYRGLQDFSLTRYHKTLLQRARLGVVICSLLIVLSGGFTVLPNVLASASMAVILLLSESGFHAGSSVIYRRLIPCFRLILSLHAFVLFFQTGVLLLTLSHSNSPDIAELSQLTLITHLILCVTTAIFLPLLSMTERQRHWQHIANQDALTGLLSRHAFISETQAIMQSTRSITSSLLVVDIDFFKAINDEHGHPVGDEVLKQVATVLKQGIRDSDLAGRLGGEEFAILMPGLDTNNAHTVANRIREAIAAMTVSTGSADINITVSIGIAESTGALSTWTELFSRADSALYKAKNSGRNLVLTDAPCN